MDTLNQQVETETKKSTLALRGHTFRIVCNSLIKLLDEGNKYYKSNRFEYAYVKFMTLIDLFNKILPNLKDFNKNLPEYNILKNELTEAVDTIEKVKTELKNREKALQEKKTASSYSLSSNSFSRSSSNEQVSSPRSGMKKTIDPEKMFKYISRIIEGGEANPPQILLIDIRSSNEYGNGHITWKNNRFHYNGVINIPLDLFYGMNVDINKVLYEAENKEFNEKKKNLIRNIYESDLIIYYDEQSSTYNTQYQIISDILFHNNNGRKIKRPPIMLENGYQGWVQFIKKSGLNLSEYIEGNEVNFNNSIDYTSRKMGAMNIGNQNINNVSKDKMNNYSNETINNNYYMQYAPLAPVQPTGTPLNIPPAPTNNTIIPSAPGQVNDLYSNINVSLPSAPPAAAENPAYPNLEDPSRISMPQPIPGNQPAIPPKPYAYATSPLPGQPPSVGFVPSAPSSQNQPPFFPTTQPNTTSYNTTNVASPPPSKIPPEIPERHNSIQSSLNTTAKLTNAASYDSLSTYAKVQPPNIMPRNKKNIGTGNPPVVPPKPADEYTLNEIHDKDHGTVGLRNLGNTCYMNSILQCLNATTLLTRFFRDGRFRNDINSNNTLGTKGRLANEYYKFLSVVWNEHLPVVSPNNIKEVISDFNSEFKGTEQHDSQEFLSCILDGLHEDLNVARRKSKSEIESIRKKHDQETKEEERGNLPLDTLQDNAWKRYLDFNWSIIVTTFQGQYMSTLKCSRCNKSSSTFNSLMYLSVPIPKNATNLYNCLDKYIEVEHLRGNDAWSCPNCKMKVDATKQLILSRLPRVMLIHLKRFYFQGPFKDKITSKINFPLTDLDLSKYTHPFKTNENKYKYNLFAISNHYGTLSGGHYTAYVKDKIRNYWVSFDDSRISRIPESKLISEAAYILFYERIE